MQKRNSVGVALCGLRKMRGLTQDQLADMVGMTGRSIRNIERGAPSTTRTINRIAAALGYEAHVTFRKKDGSEQVVVDLDDPRQQKLFVDDDSDECA